MKAIFKRELRSYFLTMTGYIFLVMFLVLAGLLFWLYNLERSTTDMGGLLKLMVTWAAFILPVLTMRMFTEDRRLGTDKLLYTAPVKESAVVFGKFLAAYAVTAAAVAVIFCYGAVLSRFGSVNTAASVSGFIGFLLLCGVYLAIGAFMSALTDSMLVAAFSTYAVLIVTVFLGNIAAIAGKGVQNVLLWLSPSARFGDLTLGILDPAVFVYYLSIIAAFLMLAVSAVGRSGKKNRLYKYAGAVIMLAVLVLANVLVTTAEKKINIKLDLTKNKLYDLSEASYGYLAQYDKATKIFILAPPAEEQTEVRRVLDRYAAANSNIRIENVDTAADPAFGMEYSKGKTLGANDIIVVSGDRSDIIKSSELAVYDNGSIAELNVESEVTSALKYVAADRVYKAYFTAGHGELELTAACESLISENYTVDGINLVTSDIPADADVVIIARPTRDLTTAELAKLDAYYRGGGSIEVYVDSTCTDYANLNDYLSSNGVRIGEGEIIEAADHMAGEVPNILFMPDIEKNDVTSGIIAKGRVMMYGRYAHPIETVPASGAVTVTGYLSSSVGAYVRYADGTTERVGAVAIAAMSENSEYGGRLYLSGTTMLLANSAADIDRVGFANAEYFTAVTNSMTGAGDAFVVPKKTADKSNMVMTLRARRIYMGIVVILIPALILGAGLFVFARRRNK